MLSLALIALFATAAIVSLVVLADCALKLRHAWGAVKHELAREWSAPVSEGAVVMLRPTRQPERAVPVTPLAVAA
ncbi:hypothetical protein G6N82_02965 [Altererythrobacter sp. BO-6]|uniref:hypothetical protein n=1 Tax=Altererythrobacter sp. BO-6 TaxID=2604537 RepID=UPI0013E16FB0|nr:hypothetical protein [Altererythrobacter sp. BO-6]QIG53249.1 hypothetical protein G6N82_02965 [Altererythrobacter sp. BO-6]